jgi:H+/Cl- antiporter ClcA
MRPLNVRIARLRREFGDHQIWISRALVLAFAALAGASVVAMVWLTDRALAAFVTLTEFSQWLPLVWTPLCTAAIVWCTRRFAPGAAGSGIPQVMAALEPSLADGPRRRLVSFPLSLAKFLLTGCGLLAGLSLGREGPSVQVAAGVMKSARRWLPARSAVTEHGLLVAGGAAGIAAAFNTPLAGVMFAIEELSRNPEQRNSGLIIAAIVLAGLTAVSVYGNNTYFGVIQVPQVDFTALLPGILVALVAGLCGGLFAQLLIHCLNGRGKDIFSRLRRAHPIVFAGCCGLAVAGIGIAMHGATYGSGYAHSRAMLTSGEPEPLLYSAMKFIATWLTAWSGVPGGIFAPALAVGGALGHDVAVLTAFAHPSTLIALGMVGFLAAATQAPLTSFIIVMEMVDGHAMVLSLMACALIANVLSKAISRPLYPTLADMQVELLDDAKPAIGAENPSTHGSV